MSTKHNRITEDIKRAVSDIIGRQVKDPRLGMVSITDVELSRDLSLAKIFFSVLGDEQAVQNSLAGLNNKIHPDRAGSQGEDSPYTGNCLCVR